MFDIPLTQQAPAPIAPIQAAPQQKGVRHFSVSTAARAQGVFQNEAASRVPMSQNLPPSPTETAWGGSK